MIHQSFISKSFKDARYTYTRWACATAAKNVIALYTTRDSEEPQWWIEQAFLVTAALCLLLDLFHRQDKDTETDEYLGCVRQAIRYLQQFVTSSVALHGVRILCSLLQEYSKQHEGVRPPTAPLRSYTGVPTGLNDMQMTGAPIPPTQSLPTNPEVPLTSEEAAQFNFDIDNIVFEDIMDYLPVEGGMDNNVFLDSIYGLTNGQLP
jgi:transcription elongation factor SPT5